MSKYCEFRNFTILWLGKGFLRTNMFEFDEIITMKIYRFERMIFNHLFLFSHPSSLCL